MNYSKRKTEERSDRISGKGMRVYHKFTVFFYRLLFIAFIAGGIVACTSGYGLVRGLIDSAPNIDSIDVMPDGYGSSILDSNGKVIQTLVGKEANREYASLETIPKTLQQAFIAIEDERFYTHNGVDVKGILRAAITGITTKDFSQGASTLTQQLLKNQVFSGGSETTFIAKLKRKVQEQYLAVELETRLNKDQILEYYLNTINLGQNTLGVQAASKRYFNKNVTDLTLSECAVIAGITQNPSAYNPITHPDANKKKRATVLSYMLEQGYITSEDYEGALADDVYKRIELVNEQETASSSVTSYFTDALFDQVLTDLKEKCGYTETQAYNAIYRGGLTIYSTQDSKIQKTVDTVINNSKYYPADSTYQLSYQISVMDAAGTETHYNEQTMAKYFKKQNTNFSLYYTDKKKADPFIKKYKKSIIKNGDTITGEVINFIIQPQTSFVLMDQSTGQVKALSGGRGTKTGSRTLNRATNTLRQPGSTFKVLSTYVPALDTSGMTLATTFDDSQYYYPNSKKLVKNWYSSGYRGLTTIRVAIANSMNVVAVKALEQVTPKTGYDYLVNMGFTSLVESSTNYKGDTFTDIALPMALGGLTNGVSNLELTTAFASVANNGIYNEAVFYTKIVDHDGNVLIDRTPETRQVTKDSTAWLLTSAMQDVIKRGTGGKLAFQNVKMPLAGKTGTTTGNKDLWFVGYTPYYTAGIWGGFDLNKKQTDTTYQKNIWRTIMERVNTNLEKKSFTKPASITSAVICTKCGKLAIDGLCDSALGGSKAKKEYFAIGTVPIESCDCHVRSNGGVYLKKDETGTTDDSPYVLK